jgi:hypothetical protein
MLLPTSMSRPPLVKETDFSQIPALIENAVLLYRLCPSASEKGDVNAIDVMVMVGIEVCMASPLTKNFKNKLVIADRANGPPIFDVSVEATLQRAIEIFKLARYNKEGTTAIARTEVMRLAGFEDITSKTHEGAAKYKKFSRRLEILGLVVKKPTATRKAPPSQIESIIIDCDLEDDVDSLSPITYNKEEATFFGVNKKSTDAGTTPTRATNKSSAVSAISSIASASNRVTTVAKQLERTNGQVHNEFQNLAFKVGTVLYNSVINNKSFLHLQNANDCAKAVNSMLGVSIGESAMGETVDFVTGSQIRKGVESGRVGQSPPRRGRPA